MIKKMQRFFVSPENFAGEQVQLVGQQAHQIRSVLRMRPGEQIIILDNTGSEYSVILTEVTASRIVGRITEKRQAAGEPSMSITLYQSLLRQSKFQWVLQKCTEVGVTHFVPVITQRSIIQRKDALKQSKLTHCRSIITEAAEQSCRGRSPQLDSPISFEEAVSTLGDFDLALIASPDAGEKSLRSALRASAEQIISVALMIGPEGGFTDTEFTLARNKGAMPVSLGRRILRTETAAVVASALILYELDRTQ